MLHNGSESVGALVATMILIVALGIIVIDFFTEERKDETLQKYKSIQNAQKKISAMLILISILLYIMAFNTYKNKLEMLISISYINKVELPKIFQSELYDLKINEEEELEAKKLYKTIYN